MLFCLDEFERFEEVVGEKSETKQQLVQLMGLLRATIQHRRRVRLLVAGNATFEELGPLWNDTFISARELRLGFVAKCFRCWRLAALCLPQQSGRSMPAQAIGPVALLERNKPTLAVPLLRSLRRSSANGSQVATSTAWFKGWKRKVE